MTATWYTPSEGLWPNIKHDRADEAVSCIAYELVFGARHHEVLEPVHKLVPRIGDVGQGRQKSHYRAHLNLAAPHLAAKRLAGCDSTHEVALVAIDAEVSGPGEIVGVVHLVDEPTEPGTAEFDIMVRTDMKGHGVGFQLMKDVLAQARRRGLKKIIGYVFYENSAMLLMASELGFKLAHVETGIVRVTAHL